MSTNNPGTQASYEVSPGKFIRIRLGDLTEESTDSIVNPANGDLDHAGGAAFAIARAAGPVLEEQCAAFIREHGPLPTGTAVMTDAGDLPCRHVIHAVGPWMGEGDEDRKLESAITSALALAEQAGLGSISIPAISSGIFRFPRDRCARILIRTAVAWLRKGDTALREIVFCNYDQGTCDHFLREVPGLVK